MASREPQTVWLSLDPRSLGLFRAALGLSLLVDVTRRIAAALAELQATLFAALVLAGLIVAWVAAARFFLGHKTSAGETLWTWLAYLVAYYASSVDAPPPDKVLACLLLWCAWLPVGGRWSLDALVRRARPPGDSLRATPRPANPLAALGLFLQAAIILVGLWASAYEGYETYAERIPRAFPAVLALASLATLASIWARGALLRASLAAIVLAGVGWNAWLNVHEAWAWTLLSVPLVLVPGSVWEALSTWSTARKPLTCYFDDDCGICQAVRRTLEGLDRAGNIAFLGNADPSLFLHAVPLELTERTIVVFDESGHRLVETRAVAALLSALPLPARIGAFLGTPGLADLADFGYRWVARNRLRISARLGLGACGTGLKAVPAADGTGHDWSGPQRPSRWVAVLLALMLVPAYNANLAGPFRLLELPEPDRLHAVLRTALFDQDWGVVGVGAACQSMPKSAPIRRFVAHEERAALTSQVSLGGGSPQVVCPHGDAW